MKTALFCEFADLLTLISILNDTQTSIYLFHADSIFFPAC